MLDYAPNLMTSAGRMSAYGRKWAFDFKAGSMSSDESPLAGLAAYPVTDAVQGSAPRPAGWGVSSEFAAERLSGFCASV